MSTLSITLSVSFYYGSATGHCSNKWPAATVVTNLDFTSLPTLLSCLTFLWGRVVTLSSCGRRVEDILRQSEVITIESAALCDAVACKYFLMKTDIAHKTNFGPLRDLYI